MPLTSKLPLTRYQPGPRPFPDTLPPPVYPTDLAVRQVGSSGKLSFRGQSYRLGRTFAGLSVALRFGDLVDGRVLVLLSAQVVRVLDLLHPRVLMFSTSPPSRFA